MFMGQGINIISDPVGIAKIERPKDMPKCPAKCMLNFANTNAQTAKSLVHGMAAPADSNLS